MNVHTEVNKGGEIRAQLANLVRGPARKGIKLGADGCELRQQMARLTGIMTTVRM